MKAGEFHWQNGWYFSRLPDGRVHIEQRDHREGDGVNAEAAIPAREWESIISWLERPR